MQTSVDIFESSQIEGLCVRDLLCVCVFGLFSRFSAVVNVFIGCETDKNAPLSFCCNDFFLKNPHGENSNLGYAGAQK